jgi:uncharacterized membrane protein YiaA
MNYTILLLHSWTRWLVVIFGLIAFLRALSGWLGRKPYTGADNGMHAAFVGAMHLQLLLGIVIYLINDWPGRAATAAMEQAQRSEIRFFKMEHIAMMILAVIFAQVGRSTSKKAADAVMKHKRAAIWFGLALLIVLLMIPWGIWNPMRPLFRF